MPKDNGGTNYVPDSAALMIVPDVPPSVAYDATVRLAASAQRRSIPPVVCREVIDALGITDLAREFLKMGGVV